MPRILIVDDEPAVRRVLQTAFEQAGYVVAAVEGPEPAMEACRAGTFDILLTDVRMPGMDGHDLARWVAVNYPSTATVLMSGYDLECQKCPYSPRCLTLNKPFRARNVVDAVNEVLLHRNAPPPPSAS